MIFKTRTIPVPKATLRNFEEQQKEKADDAKSVRSAVSKSVVSKAPKTELGDKTTVDPSSTKKVSTVKGKTKQPDTTTPQPTTDKLPPIEPTLQPTKSKKKTTS